METCLESANGPQIERKKIKEQGAVRLCGQRDHLSLLLLGRFIKDILQVRGLTAQACAVIHDLAIYLTGRKVDKTQNYSSHSGVGHREGRTWGFRNTCAAEVFLYHIDRNVVDCNSLTAACFSAFSS